MDVLAGRSCKAPFCSERIHTKIHFIINVSGYGVLSTRNRSSFPNGACGTFGRDERFISVLGGKREGERPLGRPRRRWEDNIKVDLEVVWQGVEWIVVA
jgi:hypothetical protein